MDILTRCRNDYVTLSTKIYFNAADPARPRHRLLSLVLAQVIGTQTENKRERPAGPSPRSGIARGGSRQQMAATRTARDAILAPMHGAISARHYLLMRQTPRGQPFRCSASGPAGEADAIDGRTGISRESRQRREKAGRDLRRPAPRRDPGPSPVGYEGPIGGWITMPTQTHPG